MFVLKNALKCINRSKGRNILIGIIVLVIAVSACIGLSIRQAAENARNETLADMSVTATISFDRRSMMNEMFEQSEGASGPGNFDRDEFAERMGNASSLSLSEYQTYAEADCVEDFYYTLNASFNGSEKLEAVTTDSESSDSQASSENNFHGSNRGNGMPGNMMGRMQSGDFTVIGYSGDNAMTDFTDGISSVTDGSVFDEGTSDYTCIISEELATYNNLSVGNTITLTNVNSDTETYDLTVSGIYSSTENNDFSMSMFGAGQDPANRIYMSANALQSIIDASKKASTTVTDDDTGMQYETATVGTLSATYVFANTDAYYQFEKDVRTLGLDESYTVSSTDITSFENSLTPLNTLSTMAGWFLLVILIIGAIILVVLNIFNIRERKYEIGVLTAMGMKKGKVAMQFMAEILIVTMIAIIIGTAIGAVSSVPVTNALLANQVESQSEMQSQMESNFGRPGNMGRPDANGSGNAMPKFGSRDNSFSQMVNGAANYVTEIDSAMNLTVVFQMLCIGLLLTLVASAFSILFVMRYDPLKILSNRD